jgi:hypothetical protein
VHSIFDQLSQEGFQYTVVIRKLRKNQNLTILFQNLTGITYPQFFWP